MFWAHKTWSINCFALHVFVKMQMMCYNLISKLPLLQKKILNGTYICLKIRVLTVSLQIEILEKLKEDQVAHSHFT